MINHSYGNISVPKWISVQVVHCGSLNDVVVTVVDATATVVLKPNGKDVNSSYNKKRKHRRNYLWLCETK